MLAFQAPPLVEEIIRQGLRPRTPKTKTSADELRAALDRVRRDGYAVEDEESEAGMRSVAAPIRNASGDVVAAIGVAGPVQRLSDATLAAFAPKVVQAAETVSLRLGYRSRASF
jgi:DNA-binding IclR family transcriptional regulator